MASPLVPPSFDRLESLIMMNSLQNIVILGLQGRRPRQVKNFRAKLHVSPDTQPLYYVPRSVPHSL